MKVRGGLDQNTLYECMELSDKFILDSKIETMALEGRKRGIGSILKWLKSFDNKIPYINLLSMNLDFF